MALVVPLKAGPKTSYVRDTNKPDSEKTVLELFFDAQYDIENGVQPGIMVQSGYLIENLGPRVRAPTTWETLQDGINQNTEVHKRAEQIENGDFSDDEEEDDELSHRAPPSPNSSKKITAQTPPPPSPDHEPQSNQSFSSMSNASNGSYNNSNNNNNNHQNIGKISTGTTASNSSSNSVNSPTAFSKPQPRGRPGGRSRTKRRGKVSIDEPDTVSTPKSPHNNNNYSPIAEDTPSTTSTPHNNNNNNNVANGTPNGVAAIATVTDNNPSSPHTTTGRRASGTGNGLNTRNTVAIGDMWFEAQAQLSEGRQPRICRKNGVQLSNVRQHVQKYANHAKRSSRVSPNDFLGVYISKPRKSIAADDDEDDTDNELSTSKEYSKSQGPENVPLVKTTSN